MKPSYYLVGSDRANVGPCTTQRDFMGAGGHYLCILKGVFEEYFLALMS